MHFLEAVSYKHSPVSFCWEAFFLESKPLELGHPAVGAAGSFDYPSGFTSAEGQREREREAMMEKLEEIWWWFDLVICFVVVFFES